MQKDGIDGQRAMRPVADGTEEVTTDGDALQAEPLEAEPLEAERLGTHGDRGADHTEEVTHDGDAFQAEPLQAEPLQAEPLQAEPLQADRLKNDGMDKDTRTGSGGANRTPPRIRPGFLGLLSERRFLRFWGSQIVSNIGDWAYVLAVAVVLSQRLEGAGLARTMALMLAAEVAPSALFGILLAGPIVDRFPRRRLMVLADVARAVAVGSLLLVSAPTPLHFVLVAACLGLFRALFQPALMASLPGVVAEDQLVRANAVITGTFHLAVMVGPPIGALLVSSFGATAALAVNAISFVVSGILLLGLPSFRPAREDGDAWRPVADLAAGARYILRAPIARGVTIVMGLVLAFAAWKSPAEIVFVRDVLAQGSLARLAGILGILTASWGSGMVLGSLLAPALSERIPRERLLGLCVGVVGGCFLVASRATGVAPVMLCWAVAGTAGGLVNVSYETLLQEHTPDAFRGRVFATVEAAQDAAYLVGALGVAAIGVTNGAAMFAASGIAFVGVGLVALSIMPPPPERVPVDALDHADPPVTARALAEPA
jgi:MFS family permease